MAAFIEMQISMLIFIIDDTVTMPDRTEQLQIVYTITLN